MITFHIHYKTQYGQRVVILMGNVTQSSDVRQMQSFNGADWFYKYDEKGPISYKYAVVDDHGNITKEWGPLREVSGSKVETIIQDKWRERNKISNVFLSSAFTKAIFKRNPTQQKILKNKAKFEIRFELSSTLIGPDQVYGITGNIDGLGNWKTAIPMNCFALPMWETSIGVNVMPQVIEYKYVILDAKSLAIQSWESGDNRKCTILSQVALKAVITDEVYRNDVAWRGAGIAIPVFSLRTSKSMGIGEFLDLKSMIDWGKQTNIRIIQVLPVNDTLAKMNWEDSYPYAAISINALHPLYINIAAIASFDDKKLANEYEADVKRLNALDQVDYEQVLERKFYYFRKLFNQTKDALSNDASYLQFVNENRNWLEPYAAFCHLRDVNKTANFNHWSDHQCYDNKKIDTLINSKSKSDIEFYMFLQYHADRQLLSMRDYARDNGMALKGDLPIGIYRHSCDAWIAPDLYNMSQQAGAPPDDYAELGQNWGFPTYNWEIMRQDGYHWWKTRMKQLNRYFDALRIDHILGFFRIWQIPIRHVQGTLGIFNPRLPYSRDELARYGIQGDLRRYTEPYITNEILAKTLGSKTDWVVEMFLEELGHGTFRFREEFPDQQSIALAMSQVKENLEIESAILNLMSNVLLISEDDGHHFNPRITITTTLSYQYLPMWEQQAFLSLYNEYYFRRHNEFWKSQAMDKLPALLDASDMMVCAEDLGMIPDTVPQVMQALNLLTLEIQRMPKGNARFGIVNSYPYMSVASPSCHDMSTIRGWWENDHEMAKSFYYEYLGMQGFTPMECSAHIVETIVTDHMHSPSMLAVFPLQDLVGMDNTLRKTDAKSEQINDPANPKHYWRYRFHRNIELLAENTALTEKVKNLVIQSGR